MIRKFLQASLLAASLASIASAEPVESALQRVGEETKALYEKSRDGLVRVYLPTPSWALDLMGQDFTIKRWDLTLDAGINNRLRDELNKSTAQKYIERTPAPSTQSTTQAGAEKEYRLVPRGDGLFDLVTESGESKAVLSIGARSIGVVVDALGHVLIPYYMEPESLKDQTLTVARGDGTIGSATFVGADRQTFLTVLKLDKPPAKHMELTGRKPAEGDVGMFLNVTGEYGRLTLWTGTLQDSGVLVGIDGNVCGFLRQGQFLDTTRCRAVVDQLIKHGKVSRPLLGVYIREVFPADPVRRKNPTLGTRPAVLVMNVKPDSAAALAGIRPEDIILEIGGETVGDPPSFAAVMPTLGRTTAVQILRGDQIVELTVKFTSSK